MIYSTNLDDALQKALALTHSGAAVTVIPDGVSTLIE